VTATSPATGALTATRPISRSTRTPSSSARSQPPRPTPRTVTRCQSSSVRRPRETTSPSSSATRPTRTARPATSSKRPASHSLRSALRSATRPGGFPKDRFAIDLEQMTVTCPATNVVPITLTSDGGGRASFKAHCGSCPLRALCTKSRSGRTISVHRYEQILARARAEQADPAWAAAYRSDRPIVERKISHFTRRAWEARKARTRGLKRISTDLDTRAGALNWARLAILGLHLDANGWG